MRQILLSCLLLVATLGAAMARSYRPADIPNVQRADARRYVSDPDGILSYGAVHRIDSICASLRTRGLAQVAVVAVDDIAGDDTFSFAIELFRQWGVGSARSNNGLGVLLVKNRHEIRFVTGGGVEGVLPDALCKRIQMQCMIPWFREGDYSAGMVAGVEAAAQLLEGAEPDWSGATPPDTELSWWAILALIGGVCIGFPLLAWLGRRRMRTPCPNCGRRTLQQVSVQTLEVTPSYRLEECEYECRHCGHRFRRRFRSYDDDHFGGPGGVIIGGGLGGFGGLGRGGGFGGGGFGGGGFGGGSFGGGGAGSSW